MLIVRYNQLFRYAIAKLFHIMILFNNQREFFSIVQVGTTGWEYFTT
jgi:hypothetical protein